MRTAPYVTGWCSTGKHWRCSYPPCGCECGHPHIVDVTGICPDCWGDGAIRDETTHKFQTCRRCQGGGYELGFEPDAHPFEEAS